MSGPQSLNMDDVDLGALDFWARPAEERDVYFRQLRLAPSLTSHEPPEDLLGLPDQSRQP